jgi:4-methylaminobutanoate oxidase (formaldehyde-forming)
MKSADIVIIGGGIIGCATAYYLSKMKAGRVILIERDHLAHAGSSQAAGLLTTARTDIASIQLILETYQVINELEVFLGENIGLSQNGSLHIAISQENRETLNEQTAMLKARKIPYDWIMPDEALKLVPWLDLPSDAGIIFISKDGFVDPYLLTQAYARAARVEGIVIYQETEVIGMQIEGDQVVGVDTTEGQIAAQTVIDTAGVWASLIACQIGCVLPMAPVRSEFWITSSNHLFSPNQPILVLPDANAYTRPELSRLLVGLRGNSVAVHPRSLPGDLNELVVDQDPRGWKTLLTQGHTFLNFFPGFEKIGIAHYVSGLSSYTPDGHFAFGQFQELDGFLGAAACGNGIAASAGIGKSLAELAINKKCSLDIYPFRLDRFGLIDPLSNAFLRNCAAARDHKICG